VGSETAPPRSSGTLAPQELEPLALAADRHQRRDHLRVLGRNLVAREFERGHDLARGELGVWVQYSDRYYAAFVDDLHGNNVEAVWHAPSPVSGAPIRRGVP
jgi:hypothetical protein